MGGDVCVGCPVTASVGGSCCSVPGGRRPCVELAVVRGAIVVVVFCWPLHRRDVESPTIAQYKNGWWSRNLRMSGGTLSGGIRGAETRCPVALPAVGDLWGASGVLAAGAGGSVGCRVWSEVVPVYA